MHQMPLKTRVSSRIQLVSTDDGVQTMLSALIAAPKMMARHAGLYITIFLWSLVQGVLFYFTQDRITSLIQAIGFDTGTLSQDWGGVLVGVLVFVLNISISIHLFSLVAHHVRGETKKGPSLGQAIQAGIILTLLLFGAFGLILVLVNGLVSTTGLLQNLLLVVFILVSLLGLGIVVGFSFTFSFMGVGFSFKEALGKSWQLTQKKWFHGLLFVLLVMVVSSLIAAVNEIGTATLQNEWVILLVSTFFGALATYYSATAFATAIPDEILQSPSPTYTRHPRKK